MAATAGRPGAALPHLPDHQHPPQPTETQTQADSAAVAGSIETL